jgi:hypothetical protein
VYWQTAWEHNIVAMPTSMARWTLAGLNETTEGLLMVDYEPPYRECSNLLHTLLCSVG